MYETVFFDLDGTLTEPSGGIMDSVEYALSKWNIKVADRNELRRFIGPPLVYSFKEFYGFGEEDAAKAVAYYREHFKKEGIYNNEVYADTVPVLEALKQAGKKIALATSKPEQFAKIILEHFDLAKYFDHICGATMDNSRNTKEAVLEYAMNSAGIADKSTAVMVGDRHHDIDGANFCKIDSIGVRYGFAEERELEDAGATYVVDELRDILGIILQ